MFHSKWISTCLIVLAFLLMVLLSSCDFPIEGMMVGGASAGDGDGASSGAPADAHTATFTSSPSPTSTETPTAVKDTSTPTPTPTPVPTSTYTPTPDPETINPLTGQPAENPITLCQRPLLASISNFPPSARPQAGLSVAAHVWETFIGEGMTRFLVVFFGDYIQHLQEIFTNRLEEGIPTEFVLGPFRSGRVVFEDIKNLFEGGILITSGASPEVAADLTNRSNVFGSDPNNINSAGLDLNALPQGTDCLIDPANYRTLVFDPNPPSGGTEANFLRIFYSFLNQVGWEWDPVRGVYLRYQDNSDGTEELFPATDRLTGEHLGFENVVIMWAQHRYVTETIIEMEILYVWDRKGLLLRDGKIYDIKWSTRNGKLKIYDSDGNPVPLKPGATFFQVVSWETTWDQQAMRVRYYNPPMPE